MSKKEITGPKMQVLALDTDDCVEWPGAMREGYGVKKMGTTTINAHRWVYEQTTGKKIPKGMAVDHRCRNRKCVNPKHLRVSTHSDNKKFAWGAKSGAYKDKYYKGEPVEKVYSEYRDLGKTREIPVGKKRFLMPRKKKTQRLVEYADDNGNRSTGYWGESDLAAMKKVKQFSPHVGGSVSKALFAPRIKDITNQTASNASVVVDPDVVDVADKAKKRLMRKQKQMVQKSMRSAFGVDHSQG